ncbi:MAG: PEP-CTERM sorting domain-containing protein [Phycisphaerae bacterium]
METKRIIFLFTILMTALVISPAKAVFEVDLTEGHYFIPDPINYPAWGHIDVLNLRDTVTVTSLNSSSVDRLNMYNSSFLVVYDGTIDELYLYDNAKAELHGGLYAKLYIDSESTAQVTIYARDVRFSPDTPPPAGYSGSLRGYWLDNNEPFHIGLYGPDTYSHITIVPEPASAFLVSFGALLLGLRRK